MHFPLARLIMTSNVCDVINTIFKLPSIPRGWNVRAQTYQITLSQFDGQLQLPQKVFRILSRSKFRM